MSKEKIVAMLLIGFAALGILYYLGKKKSLPAGGSGALVNGGGGTLTRAARSATSGASGSIPNIIAAAAALTGRTAAGGNSADFFTPSPNLTTTSIDEPNVLQAPTVDPIDLSGVSLPGVAGAAPDIASGVSALDAGGLDFGTLYG